MADIKKAAQDAGQKISETAAKVGHKISEAAENATDWAKEKAHEIGHRAEELGQKAKHAVGSSESKAASQIQERMQVISSCGCRVGTVDHVEGGNIKLTKDDPQAGGQHHFIPVSWVDHVDSQVHLNTDADETRRDWKPETAGAR